MKPASLKPIIHGVVATALTICTSHAMERRNSAPIPHEWIFVNLTSQDFEEDNIVDSYLESEQSQSDSEMDDIRNNKRKRDNFECIHDGDTPFGSNKSQKLETYSPIMSTSVDYCCLLTSLIPTAFLLIYHQKS